MTHDRPPSASSIGTLYGVSVGPGDPDLITVKGLKLLQQTAVVAFPAGLQGKPGIAEGIVAPWLSPQQICLSLSFPYTQDLEELQRAWFTATTQVWHHLQQGQDVAFACEGDVSFYSTFTYLAQTLQHHYPLAKVQTVPGVCSPLAAAAVLGVPLTVRRQGLVVLPALYSVQALETVLDWADVVVLLKVSSVYDQVWQVLQQRDLLSSSAIVEWATLPQQRIYKDLRDRPRLALSYFSILVVQVTATPISTG
jgi:precorrin-2/cobalt-factor-2 C20-methyltransferase